MIRTRDDKHVRFALHARRLDTIHDLHEQRDIAVEQIEAGLIGFAAQAGGDQENIAIGRAIVFADINLLVAGKSGPVQKIERFAFGHLFVGVEDLEFRNEAAALQRKGRTRTDSAATADDGDFHCILSMIWLVMAWMRASASASGAVGLLLFEWPLFEIPHETPGRH